MYKVQCAAKIHSTLYILHCTKMNRIGIIGSGTMGIGIAQVAATSGCKVFLYDANPAQTEKSLQNLQQTLNKLAAKQKISAE